MKLFALVTLCFGVAHALTCSTTGTRGSPPRKCPSGYRCKITYWGRPEVDIPNRGTCVKSAPRCDDDIEANHLGLGNKRIRTCPKTGKCVAQLAKGGTITFTCTSSGWTATKPHSHHSANYNRAYAAFNAADVDHSGTITFGGAYKALNQLFPDASEQKLDHLTKKADKAHYDSSKHKYVFRDGKIDKSEFITLYNTLLHQQQNGNSNPCKSANACGYGEACYLCKSQSRGYCCKKIMTVGPHQKPNGGLTKTEMARVTNLFQAINTHKSTRNGNVHHEYLTYSELFSFFTKVANTFGRSSNMYRQVTNTILHSDKDHNRRVDFKEFVTACAKLKKADPKDFQKFLSTAESQHALPVGSTCMLTHGSTPCAKGSECLPVAKQPQIMDGMPHIYDGIDMPDRGGMGGGRRLQYSRYGRLQYTSYKCQKRPSSCEACVKSKGKWFGSHCITKGEPQVMDAPMTSSVAGCRRKTAMNKARCSQHKSCERCTSRTKDKTYGQLCAWTAYGKGNCVQNHGSFFGPPMKTSPKMCKEDVVHVHG